jgi:hypothetical protein
MQEVVHMGEAKVWLLEMAVVLLLPAVVHQASNSHHPWLALMQVPILSKIRVG